MEEDTATHNPLGDDLNDTKIEAYQHHQLPKIELEPENLAPQLHNINPAYSMQIPKLVNNAHHLQHKINITPGHGQMRLSE